MCYVIMKIYFLFTLLFIMENNEKKQKVNKIVDLIGFFFLNLQRKILNIKVMKRILCVLIAAIWLCTCWAGNGKKPIVWEKPVAESNQLFNDPRQSQLNIYRVEFADDETRVFMHITFRPHYWVKFVKETWWI